MKAWSEQPPATREATDAPDGVPSADALPWGCVYCGAAFRLRRYLASHQAKRHQVLSPARHLAPHRWCVSCLRYYGSVQAVQTHLRHSRSCMQRAIHLIPLMSYDEIRAAEEDVRSHFRCLRKGQWQSFRQSQLSAASNGALAAHLCRALDRRS